MSDESTLDTRGLASLRKVLKGDLSRVRVGILGSKASKPHYVSIKAGEKAPTRIPTNVEVGAAHEYGAPSRGLPQRSFLRIPIATKLQEYMKDSGAFNKRSMEEVRQAKNFTPWLTKIGIIAERIVADAFATGGFGQWRAWKGKYTNNTGQILVDTTQLRNSITSEVKSE